MAITDLTQDTNAICNLALSHIGMKSLTDLDLEISANNPSALAIEKQWGPCRNDVFRDFKWPFANVIDLMTVLTTVDDDDYPEWDAFYEYPPTACIAWAVFDASTVKTKHENQFEVVYNPVLGTKIICCDLSTATSAYCEYTYNVTDPTKWDTKFVMAFSYRLAAAICVDLTGDSKKALELLNIYGAYIQEAKRLAHYEKKSKPTQSNPTVSARG